MGDKTLKFNGSEPKKSSEQFIHKDIDFYDLRLAEYEFSDQYKGVRDMLKTKRYTIQDTDTTYRMINHWSSLGLLPEDRESESHWHKFSTMDLVWINVMVELREFGMGLDKLQKTKQTLFFPDKKSLHPMGIFDVYVLHTLQRHPVYVVVLEDGTGLLATEDEYMRSKRLNTLNVSHVVINLNNIMQRMITDKDLWPIYKKQMALTPEELNLLSYIRDGDYKEVKVKFKDGKVDLFEGTQSLERQEKLADILQQDDFQEVTLKRENGKTVQVSRIVKKKLKD
jgi:DNA-binding transcriptional MerR regulator